MNHRGQILPHSNAANRVVNNPVRRRALTCAVVSFTTFSVLALSACGGSHPIEFVNVKPTQLGIISVTAYDGSSDDLLTAGLGKTGLGGAAPTFADPLNPSPAELRRLAIYINYRALIDPSVAGGYGSLYGPNVDISGVAGSGEGKIAGAEYISFADDGSGSKNVTMMVQVPSSFDPANPCIVTATSSGSRGVYGAIATAGEWGLKHGCAVAYNDKGSGIGLHDLQNNTVTLQNGTRAAAATAGKNAIFTAALSDAERAAFNAATPNRFAVKHAHSQQNPEKDWGSYTLQAVQFAYYVLNEKYADVARDGVAHLIRFSPTNTITIASSVSNGGGSALAAAEQDTQGLISGVAVAEPNVQLGSDSRLTVQRGSTSLVSSGKQLLDFFTLANLLQPCAALVSPTTNAFSTINPTIAANRCSALQAAGVISGATPADLPASAMAQLQAAGWQPESASLQASHYSFATLAVALTYANAYGRFSVADNLCGYSFAATVPGTGALTTLAPAALAASFAAGNGVPPMSGINIVANNSLNGPVLDALAVAAGAVQDYNTAGALCLRELVVGTSANALRVQQGMKEVQRSANLHGKPAIIVHGRADTLEPVAMTSRPYFGINQIVEGGASKLRFIEVTNAQHFDAFLGFPGYSAKLVPLHRYFIQAMDMLYANLKNGAPLPDSQVVRTVPRGLNGTAVNPITPANVPPIAATAAATDRITFANNVLTVAD